MEIKKVNRSKIYSYNDRNGIKFTIVFFIYYYYTLGNIYN